MTDTLVPGRPTYVWDPVVRIFHWSTAILFALNFAVIDEESGIHLWVGYILAGLVAGRLVWGVIGPRPARFAAFWPSLGAALDHLGNLVAGRHQATPVSHNPLGALMVYNLLGALTLISLTGIAMEIPAFYEDEWIYDAHELLANYAFLSVLVHIAGVFVEQRRTGVRLVKAMVTGWKLQPLDRT